MSNAYSLLRLLILIVVCASARPLSADDSDTPANPLFQEILTRVTERDRDTDAILMVKAREGCSRHPHNLNFSIEQERSHDTVVIVLHWNNKTNDGVYEKHRLVIDAAIRTELANQKNFQIKLEKLGAAYSEVRDKRFNQITGGRVRYGMTPNEVEQQLGKPSTVTRYAGAELTLGTRDTWNYQDFRILFHDDRATNIFIIDIK